MNNHVSAEAKLAATKEIVAMYVRNNQASAEEVCSLFKKVYGAIEETLPEPEQRRVGLGL